MYEIYLGSKLIIAGISNFSHKEGISAILQIFGIKGKKQIWKSSDQL